MLRFYSAKHQQIQRIVHTIMELAFATGFAAICLYGVATLYVAKRLFGKQAVSKQLFLSLGGLAWLFHSVSAHQLIFIEGGINLGLFPVLSLIGWLVIVIAFATSLLRPFENITVTAYPLAILTILLSLFFSSDYQPRNIPPDLASHVLLSILSYSVLAIAVAQAILLAVQNHQLKHKHPTGIVSMLPPLQTMESVLFEMIWMGMVLLSASIITGFMFLDDMFAQHVAHKTVFTLLAWVVFGILLAGRHALGWRGNTAIRWTFGGFSLLMIGYFGSKIVMEILLS